MLAGSVINIRRVVAPMLIEIDKERGRKEKTDSAKTTA
jgi:hypothetical protein